MSKHAPIVPPTEAERQAKVEMARGEGDLVDHFAELGRRFEDLRPKKRIFVVVKGRRK